MYHEFLELFDNHEIQNWQAKQFWEKLNISQHNRTEKTKRLMYSGLRVLMQLQYLEVDLIYAELSGDFPLGDSRQPIYKSLRPFDLVS